MIELGTEHRPVSRAFIMNSYVTNNLLGVLDNITKHVLRFPFYFLVIVILLVAAVVNIVHL